MSFAFKIDKALKANLYKICRLCGIDRDEKVDILEIGTPDEQLPVDCDGELKLHQKIIQCIGITVCKDDKMPQSACVLCVDKINDFYEFREMCYATDVQTRKLLGLKGGSQKKNITADVKPIIDIKEETGVKRGRKRKSDEVIAREEVAEVKRESAPIPVSNKKQRLNEPPPEPPTKKKGKLGKQFDKTVKPKEEIKEEPAEIEKPSTTSTPNVTKFRQVCNICDQRFGSKAKLDQHVGTTHLPNIPRYVCTACNETIKKTNDIKSHQLWHKLSKTPYICGHCNQSLISSYAYSRHLRDHTVEIPPNLWVLDRECPQCHQTFLTNFLYNTHTCAVKTKKCAGCNRQLRNEVEYQRHAAHCAKVYLNYSKHIPVAAAAAESTIRIKNENDVEAAAAEALARNAGISLNMAPVVSLTRISTPEIMAASQGTNMPEYTNETSVTPADDAKTPGKKGCKKGVSRKDLKRVDNLLKSTLDALVSIKHEPEVHVETEPETPATVEETTNKEKDSGVVDDDNFPHSDDFHHGDGDATSEDNGDENTSASIGTKDIAIKQEPVDENATQTAVNIKQEVIDVDNENSAPAAKMPVLKLKIKKEHGTLNSSIVEEQSVRVEKKKKKKKRKETERNKDKLSEGNENAHEIPAVPAETERGGDSLPHENILRPIKQERLDEVDEESESNIADSSETMQAGATVMTTIPIPQFQISAVSSGVAFGDSITTSDDMEADVETSDAAATPDITTDEGEMEDIKPNKAELDLLFKITSISSGVQMDQETEVENAVEAANVVEAANAVEAVNDATPATTNVVSEQVPEDRFGSVCEVVHRKPAKTSPKTIKHKAPEQKSRSVTQARAAKAFKSTAGVSKSNTNTITSAGETNIGEYSQIQIKPEPVDRGYEDVFNAFEAAKNPTEAQTLFVDEELSMREIAEQEYLNNIDFTNIQIKQEKDVEVSDVEMTNTHIVANAIPNGMKCSNGEESQYSGNEEDTDSMDNEETDDEEEDDDDDDNDWVGVKKEEEEKREYRELELPPLLSTEDSEVAENQSVHEDKLETELNNANLECPSEEGINATLVNEPTTSTLENEPTTSTLVNEPTTSTLENEPTTSTLLIAEHLKANEAELLPPPFMITGIYSQADCDVSNQFSAIMDIAPPPAETDYPDAVMELPAEANTLKIANVVAGCSNSFDDYPKQMDEEKSFITSPVEAMEVADVPNASTSMATDDHTDLPDSIPLKSTAEEAMDIIPAAETMCIEVSQGKDALLEAQPFSDGSAEPVTAVDTPQIEQLNSNTNIALDIPIQSDTTVAVGEATENVVEEAQNVLNHEVVQAQAIQRLTLEVTEPNHQIAEETENLLNESVVEAQMQQQQACQTDAQSGSGVPMRMDDPESEKSYSNASNSNGSIDGSNGSNGSGSGSGVVSASGSIGRSSQSTMINHPFMLDDSNINEIAENNNNANIERELQDDVAATSAASTSAANVADNAAEEQSNAMLIDMKPYDIT
ncbi:uncharacterized protein LOC129248429 [Anastrepha obliqua]|uniref:uncharacterized protein LOC129248429 n=1 Tax=Anastrepha obliqua TaxID=95512 RepID=UPI00240A66CD|nr:uncharacterized protein LOC129248429 [Anastrepha obliqua]